MALLSVTWTHIRDLTPRPPCGSCSIKPGQYNGRQARPCCSILSIKDLPTSTLKLKLLQLTNRVKETCCCSLLWETPGFLESLRTFFSSHFCRLDQPADSCRAAPSRAASRLQSLRTWNARAPSPSGPASTWKAREGYKNRHTSHGTRSNPWIQLDPTWSNL